MHRKIKFMKKIIASFLTLLLFFSSSVSVFQSPLIPKAYAETCIYQFQTQQLDPESGMYFLRARYYDPKVGRFISRDPIEGTLTNPQTQNPYVYSGNNIR